MSSPPDVVTCREVSGLLAPFFDGELDPRQMRAVALHGTRCGACESELRSLEKLHGLLSTTIEARVDEIDFSAFWSGIESNLATPNKSRRSRLSAWWAERQLSLNWGWPALAAAAAAAIFALFMFTRSQPSATTPEAPQIAAVDNSVSIDSVDADGSVAVITDPETRTTVLWVSEENALEEVP